MTEASGPGRAEATTWGDRLQWAFFVVLALLALVAVLAGHPQHVVTAVLVAVTNGLALAERRRRGRGRGRRQE